MKDILEHQRMFRLLNGYLAITKKVTPQEFFKTDTFTYEEQQSVIKNKQSVENITESGKIKIGGNRLIHFFENSEISYYAWYGEDGFTSLRLNGKEPELTNDQSYRFGYVTKTGEIHLLFNGDYVAESKIEARELFAEVQKWVKENVLTEATVFANQINYQ